MGRVILSILGVILAIWLVLQVIGWIIGMVKLFVFIAIIATIAYLAITLIAKTSRSR